MLQLLRVVRGEAGGTTRSCCCVAVQRLGQRHDISFSSWTISAASCAPLTERIIYGCMRNTRRLGLNAVWTLCFSTFTSEIYNMELHHTSRAASYMRTIHFQWGG